MSEAEHKLIERAAACMTACDGIANPKAIPALIEAAKAAAKRAKNLGLSPALSYDEALQMRMIADSLYQALAALEEGK